MHASMAFKGGGEGPVRGGDPSPLRLNQCPRALSVGGGGHLNQANRGGPALNSFDLKLFKAPDLRSTH